MGFFDKMSDKLKSHFQDIRQDQGQAVSYGGPTAPPVNSGRFVHPGTTMGPNEIGLMKARVAQGLEPWRTAADKLSAKTPIQYSPRPLQDVDIDYGGKGAGHLEFVEQDGCMVYQQTLMWLITENPAYAQNAIAIIQAWATTCRKFCGRNAPLEAGWGIASMARSVELLKYTYSGWNGGLEAQFLRFVDALIMPCLNSPTFRVMSTGVGNWHTTNCEAKMQLAILRENRATFNEQISEYKRYIDETVQPSGEYKETKRDMYHSQFALGSFLQVAEMAWQQGIDLYGYKNGLIARFMEFHAFIVNGGDPAALGITYKINGNGWQPCAWEVGYNHYNGRMGIPMPETNKLLAKNRPEMYCFHWGLGTLTHCGTAQALSQSASGIAPS